MTNNTTKKALSLLLDNNLQELKELLTQELLKETPTKSNSLEQFNAVKSFLKHADKSKPTLQTIMKLDNTQFICNGYSLYIFNEYVSEFENLPQISADCTPLNYKAIVKDLVAHDNITVEDMWTLQNVKKFIDYVKANHLVAPKDTIKISFNNRIYNAEFLLGLTKIYKHDFENLKYSHSETQIQGTYFNNGKIESYILPLRITDEQTTTQTLEIIEKFKKDMGVA